MIILLESASHPLSRPLPRVPQVSYSASVFYYEEESALHPFRMNSHPDVTSFTIRVESGGSRRPHRDGGPAKDEDERVFHYLDRASTS